MTDFAPAAPPPASGGAHTLTAAEVSVGSDNSAGPDTATVAQPTRRDVQPHTGPARQPTGLVPMADTVLGGHYRLQTRLGHGGMADVWQALDERLDRSVAIKLFRPEATQPQRERNEMRLLANLNHPGLVTVFDAGVADDSYGTAHSYLVMELITGPPLSYQLDLGRIPPAVVAEMGVELASAFAYIHQRGIVHRDVKPANILLVAPLSPGAQFRGVKLTDFGIARMLDDTRLTEHGMTIGTPNYLSPEQVRADELSPASDVYSLGLLLVECLTGQVVYPGHGIEAAIARLHRAAQVPPELGPAWAGVLQPMLAIDPAARPSAAAVATALGRIDDHSWTVRPEQPRTEPSPPLSGVPAAAVAPGGEPVERRSDFDDRPATGSSPVPWDEDGDVAQERSRGGTGWLVAAAVLLLVLLATVWFIVHSAGSHRSPGPSYPAVTGKLGSDLSRLQKDVQP